MNSSTGFKKRPLLRPPSGLLSHQRQFLKIIDISQSEPLLATNIESQVASIQEQINLLDKDKRIRTGQVSLDKGYILTMKKWLKEVQVISQKQDDDAKILKYMGVDSYEAGFKKLWRILSNLDLIASKMTQLQIVHFLIYDEMFGKMTDDSQHAQRLLEKISKGGFTPSNFHISQLILDRDREIYAAATDLKRQSSGMSSSKGFTKQTKNQTNQLIQQLRNENSKLTELLQQFQQRQKENLKKHQQPKIITEVTPVNAQSVFTQLQNKYREQIKQMSDKNKQLTNQLATSKTQVSQLEIKLKIAQNQLKEHEKSSVSQKPKPGSYQQALLEEMTKMKAGFQRKILNMTQQYSSKEKDMRRKQYEYKTENDKIRWQKGLLLKKYEVLTTV